MAENTPTQNLSYDKARDSMKEGKVLRRASWPIGTLLVLAPKQTVKVEEWSDKSPLTKDILNLVGITESLEIHAHYDLLAHGRLETGYRPDQSDVIADDWEIITPKQADKNADENIKAGLGNGPGNSKLKDPDPVSPTAQNTGQKTVDDITDANSNVNKTKEVDDHKGTEL